MKPVVIRAEHLSKRYAIARREAIQALDDVSFEIRAGEIVGIAGRNGAGKSTLLKILSRVTDPTTGFAEMTGRVGSLLEVGTGFHDDLTGRENTYLNGAILGMRKAEIDRRFDEIVAFAGVERFIDTPVKRYSSGMYMRLAFAVAAHLDADILLVDEALAVGDAQFQNRCLGRIDAVARNGRTVVFVTHNLAMLERLASVAMWIDRGRLASVGPPRSIVARYFAADAGAGHGYAASRRTGRPQFLSAVLVYRDGSIAGRLSGDDECRFQVRYVLPEAWPGLTVGISVLASDGVPIFTANTADAGLSLPGQAREYEATVVVPRGTLAGGQYHLGLRMWDRGDTYDFQEPALSFSVEPPPRECPDERRRGLVHVPCAWTLAPGHVEAGAVECLR
jgi:lipopolysaccharide transport system ATP-binding protein